MSKNKRTKKSAKSAKRKPQGNPALRNRNVQPSAATERSLQQRFTSWYLDQPGSEDSAGVTALLEGLFQVAPDFRNSFGSPASLALPTADLVVEMATSDLTGSGHPEVEIAVALHSYLQFLQLAREPLVNAAEVAQGIAALDAIITDAEATQSLSAFAPATAQAGSQAAAEVAAPGQSLGAFAPAEASAAAADAVAPTAPQHTAPALSRTDVRELPGEFADTPAEVLLRDLNATAPVAAVAGLLDWLGKGKPVTSTGALRRADIEPVAALLGIAAAGVAKVPDGAAGDGTAEHPFQVKTMWELEPLAAFWVALQELELLELTSTKALPGAGVAQWNEADPDRAAAIRTDLLATYVGTLLECEDEKLSAEDRRLAEDASREVRAILVQALRAGAAPAQAQTQRGAQLLERLHADGLLSGNGAQATEIPAGVKFAAAIAVANLAA
ncbi:hypothetical protein NQ038_07635 [Brevibacterium sp. 50QC2O2]|jgi:surface antigen|uniref:hypothetical protein n=1 Tax=Brevibacterium sp. 50QC2O2 TaxID=2968459 RepID=UPI00211CD8A0|nr:hypothetical protein [Brevibacterium sp. 50QC2O2]MCQ9388517.1 hypothetical protein [Brevibacterium sp. 50QC2O2]